MPPIRSLVDTPARIRAKEKHALLWDGIKAKRRAKAAKARGEKIRQQGLSIDAVNMAIIKSAGLVNPAAAALGVSRGTLSNFIKTHNECAKLLKEAREVMGDVAEEKLHELIKQGDVRCIMYYLSTVHRARGYGVRKDDAPSPEQSTVLTVNVVSVPSGHFLSKEEARQLTIDHVPSPPTDPLS